MTEQIKKVVSELRKQGRVSAVMPFDMNSAGIFVFDFTSQNAELAGVDFTDVDAFNAYVFGLLERKQAIAGIGRYDEDRVIYQSQLFIESGKPARTVHLGIDIWTKPGTKVFAPVEGIVHSYANNANYLDYGPTIVLEHEVAQVKFFTLYGHLSKDSLDGLAEGASILSGQEIARVGNYPVNGTWPPHLHFQIMSDMLGKRGDYPGVCSLEEREKYLALCPDPNIILGIERLIGN